jgi:hypothetical protein
MPSSISTTCEKNAFFTNVLNLQDTRIKVDVVRSREREWRLGQNKFDHVRESNFCTKCCRQKLPQKRLRNNLSEEAIQSWLTFISSNGTSSREWREMYQRVVEDQSVAGLGHLRKRRRLWPAFGGPEGHTQNHHPSASTSDAINWPASGFEEILMQSYQKFEKARSDEANFLRERLEVQRKERTRLVKESKHFEKRYETLRQIYELNELVGDLSRK